MISPILTPVKGFVVGGGPSATKTMLQKLYGKPTIVANKAFLSIPDPSYFISVDNSFYNKLTNEEKRKFNNSTMEKVFIVNYGSGTLKKENNEVYDIRFKTPYHLSIYDTVIESHKVEGMGFSVEDFRTGNNSGYCALQFAILKGFNPIYLVGVGLTLNNEKTHHHGGYGEPANIFMRKLEIYREQFVIGLKDIKKKRPDIKIYSCSPNGYLNKYIPYRSIDE